MQFEKIRKANAGDIRGILAILHEVLEIHAKIRPDLFISGTTKYTDEELTAIIENPDTPVFVAVDGQGQVLGYAFCVLLPMPKTTNMRRVRTLYVDDLGVDKAVRGEHIGTRLMDYVKDFAREAGCYAVTLNVWEGNDSARGFYEHYGMKVRETQMEVIL